MIHLVRVQQILCGYLTSLVYEYLIMTIFIIIIKVDNLISSNYWSSSPNVSNSNNAWNVNFKNGNSNNNNKTNNNYVRCARAG